MRAAMEMHGVTLILAAAGSGTRMGLDKLWVEVAGRPLVAWTMNAVAAAGRFDQVMVVARPRDHARLLTLAAASGLGTVQMVSGGERRQDSVRGALETGVPTELVCIHDAARVLCPPSLFAAVIEAARRDGAATVAVPLVDSVKQVDASGAVVQSVERSALRAAQTPQAFRTALLVEAHRRAVEEGWIADDDTALVERLGHAVVTVPGDPANLKVTSPHDLVVVRAQLEAR